MTERDTGLDTWSRLFYLVHGPVTALALSPEEEQAVLGLLPPWQGTAGHPGPVHPTRMGLLGYRLGLAWARWWRGGASPGGGSGQGRRGRGSEGKSNY